MTQRKSPKLIAAEKTIEQLNNYVSSYRSDSLAARMKNEKLQDALVQMVTQNRELLAQYKLLLDWKMEHQTRTRRK